LGGAAGLNLHAETLAADLNSWIRNSGARLVASLLFGSQKVGNPFPSHISVSELARIATALPCLVRPARCCGRTPRHRPGPLSARPISRGGPGPSPRKARSASTLRAPLLRASMVAPSSRRHRAETLRAPLRRAQDQSDHLALDILRIIRVRNRLAVHALRHGSLLQGLELHRLQL
jgi:hypothetical protein